jgi:hypothetical protein
LTTLQSLKQKLVKDPLHPRLASHCFDGMTLSPSIRYDQHADKIVGYEESNTGDNVANIQDHLNRRVGSALFA